MTMSGESLIRHSRSHLIDTVRGDDRSGEEAPVTTANLSPNWHETSPDDGHRSSTPQLYGAPMTTTVNSVIAAINARRPGMSDSKIQALLYFCQGHHLAHFDEALFAEPIYATERGVAVEDVPGEPEPAPTHEGPLNTIGYALERYGNLSPVDLRHLIQASTPWQSANKAGGGARIEWAWLRDWFRRPDETNDPEDDRPTAAEAAEVAAFWRAEKAR